MDQERVLREGTAQHHRAAKHHQQGWVSFRIGREKDVEGAKEVVKLAYNNARDMKVHESKPGARKGRESCTFTTL
jgi:hypothetical protein